MMGGMGVFIVLGLFACIVLIRWLLSQPESELHQKRKNEDMQPMEASYDLEDDGDQVPIQEKSKRSS